MKRDEDLLGRKPTSKISLHIVSSTGEWLNGSDIPQRRFVEIRMNDAERKLVSRAAMTLDQFATFLVSNSETVCTLLDYRDEAKLIHEEVEPPETVNDRMTKRMGDSHKELNSRIEDLEKDIYEMINGGKKGEKQLEELYHNIKVIKSHYESNDTFVVEQVQEEVGKIQENMRAQILNVASGLGLNVNKEDIKALEGNREDLLKLSSGEKKSSVPVTTGYEKKLRKEKPLEEMTLMEVANEMSLHLKYLEKQEKSDEERGDSRTQLFMSSTSYSRKNVFVTYISFQGTTPLSLDEAKNYLKFLRTVKDIKDFKTHYWYNKEEEDE